MKCTVKRIAAIALTAMLALASMGSALAAEYYSVAFSAANLVVRPTAEPTVEPVAEPTAEPTVEPTAVPAVEPTAAPAAPAATVKPTAAPAEKTAAPAVDKDESEVVVLAQVPVNGDADIRLAANGLSEIIATIPDGTVVAVTGVEGDWVAVSVDDVTGYIYIDSVLALWDVEGVLPEPTQTPEPEPGVTPAPNFKVTIFSSRRSVMTPGETVYLTSKLEGFEGYEIRYQWQCDKGDGFEDVPDADGDTYSFSASVETLGYDWRLAVYYR